MGYLEIQYSESRVPVTEFPYKLAEYLASKFDLPSALTVLELGCGRRDFLHAWKKFTGGFVRGVDMENYDHKMVVYANLVHDGWYKHFMRDLRKTYSKCDQVPARVDNGFDLVFSKSVIEHLTDPTAMLTGALGCLRPNGRAIIMAPDWRTYMPIYYDDYTHVRAYDVVSLPDAMRAAGFMEVTCELIYQYPPMWRSKSLRVLAAIWRRLVPLDLSIWLTEKTGIGFFRWSSLLTLLATGVKP